MKNSRITLATILVSCLLCFNSEKLLAQEENTESLPALVDNQPPTNFDELWAGYDPRKEPLETEVIKEWEEDGVILRVVRFRIGIFKGKKAMLAGIYGFPKNAGEANQKIPGLLQIHGGGQYAHHQACLSNAKRGYATISISWAGRISAPGYIVNPDVVKLFWDGKTEHPKYKLTTDWGALDAYHAPCRNNKNNFLSVEPAEWTLDSIPSPRNSPWFLCTLAARRSLTFLERQPEVDAERLGVYGHSMGGKLTVLTSFDSRVKAAAPSCGGISDRENPSPLFQNTVADSPNLQQIQCPIMFLMPANDFHGRISDMPTAIEEIQSQDWRISSTPHLNHVDIPQGEVATQIWFDQHLKNNFHCPQNPETSIVLTTDSGSPTFRVVSDSSTTIASVDVYYTQDGKDPETRFDRENTMTRFWRYAKPTKNGDSWTANLNLESTEKPLWVYANVNYKLDNPIQGAGYYYGVYNADSFQLSSLLTKITAKELVDSKCKATIQTTNIIDSFENEWQKNWFARDTKDWARSTHNLKNSLWAAPPHAVLELTVYSESENRLVVMLDDFATEVELTEGKDWQTVQIRLNEFQNETQESLPAWNKASTLKLSALEHIRSKDRNSTRKLGGTWKGAAPKFRDLKWTVPTITPPTRNHAPEILDVFPPGTAPKSAGSTTINEHYQPSPSLWAEGLDETQVFQAELANQNDPENPYSLRIGKGGQIYSLRGLFGESVPPSWRPNTGKSSPWNDEVWQFVAVCSKYNGFARANQSKEIPEKVLEQFESSEFKNSFFVHNSGAYIPKSTTLTSLYCPNLAVQSSPETGIYRILNWGLVPQVKSVHRSPILYYTQVRDVGDGVIELTWVVHNFSIRDDVVFDHLNSPWGGTRISSLPFRYVSSPNGELLEREGVLNKFGTINVDKTAGWNLSCASQEDDSPSLALVYGRDKHLPAQRKRKSEGKEHIQTKNSLYRDWRANKQQYEEGARWGDWRTRPANSFRNYDVCEIIPKLLIKPGKTIWFRSFLVLGNKTKVIAKATKLVDHVNYGALEFPADSTPMRDVSPSQVASPAKPNKAKPFQVFAHPVKGTMPLFQIRNLTTKQTLLTTDPYFFVKQKPLDIKFPEDHPFADYYTNAVGYSLDEHNSDWQSLVGYGYKMKPAAGNWKRLSEVLPASQFPAATKHHLDLWVSVAN